MARYVLVDVFTDEPLAGNQLAVFPEPGSVPTDLMQAIARELNLSETVFVQRVDAESYDVRIFTPASEMPFAGHPTVGTAWVLRNHEKTLSSDTVVQHSPAGETPITFTGELVGLERGGTVGDEALDVAVVARALGIDASLIGFDALDIGCEGAALDPGYADAGVRQLMVPIRDPDALAGMVIPSPSDLFGDGVYCFAPLGEGRIKTRFFAEGIGISEDPATGSAAAGLGLYIGARCGPSSFVILQGAEIGRPSAIAVEAEPGRVRVGGSVRLVGEGTLYV